MRIVPKNEWGKYTDPESQEFSPTYEDIERDRQIEEGVGYGLKEIEDELAHPNRDRYTGEERKFGASDPEMFWDTLESLADRIRKIKDPGPRKKLEAEVLKIEQEIYKQYIPFIESNINFFGWRNSPLSPKDFPGRGIGFQEVEHCFDKARAVLGHFKVSENERDDFLNELNRLQEKLERYQKEPTLFTFEQIEEELYKAILDNRYDDFYARSEDTQIAIDDDRAQTERFDLLLKKARSLQEIAEGMIDELIKLSCKERSRSFVEHIEFMRAESEAPRELLTARAKLKDLFYRARNGEKVGAEELDDMDSQLSQMKDYRLGGEHGEAIQELDRLLSKIRRIAAGGIDDEDDDRFYEKPTGTDWAWSLLGIARGATKEEAKEAYRKLARKHHPDINKKDADATEKMQRINEAFELVRKIEGFN